MFKKRLAVGLAAWTAALTGAHLGLNVDWTSVRNDYLPEEQRRLNVGYLPVT
jgi:hypothetical protein